MVRSRSAIATQDLVAVTVNMDVERGVANQIEPGDHVDIAQTLDGVEGGDATTSYLLRNVKVLAVGVATVPQPAVAPTADATAAADAGRAVRAPDLRGLERGRARS